MITRAICFFGGEVIFPQTAKKLGGISAHFRRQRRRLEFFSDFVEKLLLRNAIKR